MESQGLYGGLPHLRGGNITLESITTPHPVENRRTKIICTLGPACWEVDQLEKLIDAGMSIARFNFSHGDHEGHLACLNRLRTAARNRNKPIGMYNGIPDVALFVIESRPSPMSLSSNHNAHSCHARYQGSRNTNWIFC